MGRGVQGRLASAPTTPGAPPRPAPAAIRAGHHPRPRGEGRGLRHSRTAAAIVRGNQGPGRRGWVGAQQGVGLPGRRRRRALRPLGRGGGGGEGARGHSERVSREKAQRAFPLPSPPKGPRCQCFTVKKRAQPGAGVRLSQLRPPPRSPPPEQAAAATDRDSGPANSFPSNPALPPPANRRRGRRAPRRHVTVSGRAVGEGERAAVLSAPPPVTSQPKRVPVVATRRWDAMGFDSSRNS